MGYTEDELVGLAGLAGLAGLVGDIDIENVETASNVGRGLTPFLGPVDNGTGMVTIGASEGRGALVVVVRLVVEALGVNVLNPILGP